MSAYILKRLLLMMPTLLGVLLRHLRRDPVRAGRAGGAVLAEAQGACGGVESGGSAYRGDQGVDPKRIEEIKALYGFDKPAHERFLQMLGQFARFDLGKSFFQNKDVWTADPGKAAGVDQPRAVDLLHQLPDRGAAGRGQGGARRHRASTSSPR